MMIVPESVGPVGARENGERSKSTRTLPEVPQESATRSRPAKTTADRTRGTLARFLTAIAAGSLTVSVGADTLVETYWPMHDGDITYYSGTGGSAYIQVRADTVDTPSQFELDLYASPDSFPGYTLEGTMNFGYSDAKDAAFNYSLAAAGYTVYITPPWQLLNNSLLSKGGRLSGSFTGTIPGIGSAPFSATVTVQSVGTVTVPAGTYRNCKSLSMTLKANGAKASGQAYILAPKVGPIKIAVFDENLKVIGWQSLTGGTVGGVDVGNLTDSTPPTVTLSSPGRNAQVTTDTIVAAGTANDDGMVAAVYVQLNDGAWTLACGTNAWTASPPTLTPGTNTLRVYAVDTSGNCSTTNSVTVFYALSARVAVGTIGGGTVTPNLNGQSLQIGQNVSMTAKPCAGCAFSCWSGSIQTTNPTLKFLMTSNLTLTATFVDITRPVNVVSYPAVKQSITNATIAATGKAMDNVGVETVWYRFNGADWTNAATSSGFTNWTTAPLTLVPGTNVIAAFARDAAGNASLTNSVSVFYALNAKLAVGCVGAGTITPNLNGQSFPVGRVLSMTAKPAPGFAFWYWNGSIQTTNPTLKFIMASNLTFTANFVDVTRPVNIVSYPAVNQLITNATITATGKAKDNVGVQAVWYQFNGCGWTNATTSNAFTNWTTSPLTLSKGTNVLAAFAVDPAGNASLTNTVRFRH